MTISRIEQGTNVRGVLLKVQSNFRAGDWLTVRLADGNKVRARIMEVLDNGQLILFNPQGDGIRYRTRKGGML